MNGVILLFWLALERMWRVTVGLDVQTHVCKHVIYVYKEQSMDVR